MHIIWKDLRYKEDSTTQLTLPLFPPPSLPCFKTKKLRTLPSKEISICAHDTFCFRPLSCGGHFDLYPTPSLLRSFGKRRDVTIWKKPRASGAAAPLPPPSTAPGLTGSARPAVRAVLALQKHYLTYISLLYVCWNISPVGGRLLTYITHKSLYLNVYFTSYSCSLA